MDNFTKRSKKVLEVFAQFEAKRLNSDSIGPEHIFLGLLKDDDSVAARILKNLGLKFEMIRKKIEQTIGRSGKTIVLGNIPVNIRYNKILELAKNESKKILLNYVGTEHLLLAIFKDATCAGIESLYRIGIDYNAVKNEVVKITCSYSEINDSKIPQKSKTPTLDEFSRNLTAMAESNLLDPVIGRDKEIDRVIRIVSRKTKNNPVLIGEAGVGKTAIVEGLALRIVHKEIPEPLQNKIVLALDIAAIVAGTKFRGEFEERIKRIIKEIKNEENIIIFIDELHTIIGAGAAEGAIDAANILKPALARGELQCIGATTLGEYKKYIEKDSALERRFQKVLIGEPNVEESIKILQGLKERYEIHHKVKYTDDAIEKAVLYSYRYINDRFLPDKAIDIIDEAGSKVRLENSGKPENILTIENEIKELNEKKNNLVMGQEYEQAAAVRDLINSKKEVLNTKVDDWKQKRNEYQVSVDADDIALILAQSTGIPVERLNESETNKLLRMEEELHKKIIGQDAAISAVSKAIRRSRIGLKGKKGPIGSFIFLGPTGVGKTELAKVLSEFLFDDPDSIVRLDMSEYMERHSVSRLIGAPPGYIGFEGGGLLTEKIKRRPYSVILFDEIEKAHFDVFNILLQILEEGELTDSFGSSVSFRDTIVILTSNIGNRDFSSVGRMGFDNVIKDLQSEESSKAIEEVKRLFSPELLNRIHDVIYFHRLEKSHIERIVDIMLNEVNNNLKEREIELKFSGKARKFLVERGYNEKYGARFLRRTITTEVEDTLALSLLKGSIDEKKILNVGVKGESLYFKAVKPEPVKEQEPESETDLKNNSQKTISSISSK
ncbi:MAG: ATP-dependent Clp protease ATP-binding subunit [Spirochaetes bacterium]|nr:ATP-dependent Clp protease ATP-binding subunit [Spirochaetota bacterium]